MKIGNCLRCGVDIIAPHHLIRERDNDDSECKTYKCPNCYTVWTFDEVLKRLVRS